MSTISQTKDDRTNVEKIIIDTVSRIQTSNNLKNMAQAYDHIIENWFMFDAHWLAMVRHMKETGRLYEVCSYCNGTGQHLCPDVVQPILVNCSNKNCTVNNDASR